MDDSATDRAGPGIDDPVLHSRPAVLCGVEFSVMEYFDRVRILSHVSAAARFDPRHMALETCRMCGDGGRLNGRRLLRWDLSGLSICFSGGPACGVLRRYGCLGFVGSLRSPF